MKKHIVVLAVMTVLVGSTNAGCATKEGEARIRGSNDLECPPKQVVVEEQRYSRYRVTGCNQVATYHCEADAKLGYYCSEEEGPQPLRSPVAVAPPPPPVKATLPEPEPEFRPEPVPSKPNPPPMASEPEEKEPAFDTAGWLALQKTNSSVAGKLFPLSRKAILGSIRTPTTAKFGTEEVALQCPDKDTFITMHEVNAQNGFGAMVKDNLCVAVSLQNKRTMVTDCGGVSNVKLTLAMKQHSSLRLNVLVACMHPTAMLHLRP